VAICRRHDFIFGVLRMDGTHRSLRLILAEDNQGVAITFATLLRTFGHAVTLVHDGPTALRITQAEQPDAVLLDIGLPRMDGYEVARQLRGDVGMDRVWLIAMTCYGSEADRQRSKQAGFDHHCVKPIDFTQLNDFLCGLGERSYHPESSD